MVDLDLERFNHIRLRAVPQDGRAMRTKKTRPAEGKLGGASLSFQFPSWQFRSLQSCRALTRLTEEGRLFAVYNSELKQESADVPDVMSSNRKFDVSLINRKLLSHTVNLNAFVLTPAVRICRIRALKERQYQLPVAILMSVTSTFTLLKVPNDTDEVSKELRELGKLLWSKTDKCSTIPSPTSKPRRYHNVLIEKDLKENDAVVSGM